MSSLFSFLIGSLASVIFYGVLYVFRDTIVGKSFFERGIIPYFIVLFTFWALAILIVKWSKLRVQKNALRMVILPDDPQFVLSPDTVESVTERIYLAVDDPKHFMLLHRILIALSNLRNIGQLGDVDDILRAQSDNDASSMETSYYIVQVFVWAIPVLGFIGTVLGLSEAIGGFGLVLSTSDDMGQLKVALRAVTSGLATAFETTLHGLVAALAVQLLITSLKKSEEEFLEECNDYCIRHLVNRLRLRRPEAGTP